MDEERTMKKQYMTVEELINVLQTMPQDLPVKLCNWESSVSDITPNMVHVYDGEPWGTCVLIDES